MLFARAFTAWLLIQPAIKSRKISTDSIQSSRLPFACATANRTSIFRCFSVLTGIRRTGEADPMITLAENSYGKSRVRLAKVKRHPDRHDFREWTVEIALEGDFESCFVAGDNSKILPTDTMKNTVYSLARTSSADCIEKFGKELAAHFLERNPQVSGARVALSEKSWQHLHTNGRTHPTTFVQSSDERQTAEVVAARNVA